MKNAPGLQKVRIQIPRVQEKKRRKEKETMKSRTSESFEFTGSYTWILLLYWYLGEHRTLQLVRGGPEMPACLQTRAQFPIHSSSWSSLPVFPSSPRSIGRHSERSPVEVGKEDGEGVSYWAAGKEVSLMHRAAQTQLWSQTPGG